MTACARRLPSVWSESKQTIPHFYVSVDCELDALLELRAQLNHAAPRKDDTPAYKLSVNDMVIKAHGAGAARRAGCQRVLDRQRHGQAQACRCRRCCFHPRRPDHADHPPGGRKEPVGHLQRDEGLGKRAKERKLKPEEYQGGTTAVSNMGMMGVKNFAAVVNPPHATILAVGAGEKRVIVKNGEMVIAQVMTVTLSTDHRCVDGALGAELLGSVQGLYRKPDGHAGLSRGVIGMKTILCYGDSLTWGHDAARLGASCL